MTSQIGQSIQFTITERRLVSAMCVTNFAYSKTGGGASGTSAAVSVAIDGLNSYGDAGAGSSATTASTSASVVAATARIMEPGTYTVTCGAELYVSTATSSPTGFVAMEDPYLLQVIVHGIA